MAQGRSWVLKRITLLASRDTIEFIALSAFQGCFPAPVCMCLSLLILSKLSS